MILEIFPFDYIFPLLDFAFSPINTAHKEYILDGHTSHASKNQLKEIPQQMLSWQ